jgi:hypothetical protein
VRRPAAEIVAAGGQMELDSASHQYADRGHADSIRPYGDLPNQLIKSTSPRTIREDGSRRAIVK